MVRPHRILLTLCLAIPLRTPSLLAQRKTAGICDVLVVVTDFFNQLVPNLQVSVFSIRFGGIPGVVNSVSTDVGPNNVLFWFSTQAKMCQRTSGNWRLKRLRPCQSCSRWQRF